MSKENKFNCSKFPFTLTMLKDVIKKYGTECFYSEEMIVKTNFGNYNISKKLFNAKNYDDFVVVMAHIMITEKNFSLFKKKPSINHVCDVIDNYIRTKLFNKPFDPYIDNNFQVLKIAKVGIIEHIIKDVSKLIYGISIEKIIKIIKNLKKTIAEQEKTIIQQDMKIREQLTENSMLYMELEKIKEEKSEIEKQTKTEKEQKIDEILKLTKKIEEYINTQTKC